jgi:hypothetical protein
MTTLRRLNDAGIERFVQFLSALTTAVRERLPVEILTSPQTSEELETRIDIEDCVFANRLQAARYLHEKFDGARFKGVESGPVSFPVIWAMFQLRCSLVNMSIV